MFPGLVRSNSLAAVPGLRGEASLPCGSDAEGGEEICTNLLEELALILSFFGLLEAVEPSQEEAEGLRWKGFVIIQRRK